MEIPRLIAALLLVSMVTQLSLSALLSYEAQDTVLDLMTEKGFSGLVTTNLLMKDGPRPIYRKDLGTNHIAYYEILSGDGKEFYLLSAGSKTGDNRFVESGEINATAQQYRPTDALNIQARKNGQSCYRHYRLSQAGLYMCEDQRGTPVAATYNWTSNAPVSLCFLKFLILKGIWRITTFFSTVATKIMTAVIPLRKLTIISKTVSPGLYAGRRLILMIMIMIIILLSVLHYLFIYVCLFSMQSFVVNFTLVCD